MAPGQAEDSEPEAGANMAGVGLAPRLCGADIASESRDARALVRKPVPAFRLN